VELHELLAARRMVRSFDGSSIDEQQLADLCAQSLWAPTAGNAAGVRMHIVGRERVGDYFKVATDEEWRRSARRAPGLQRASAVVLVTSKRTAYLDRYGEEDKRSSGLSDENSWPVPYWHTDAAMATMALLLLVEEAGLAATLWGNFRHEEKVLQWARVDGEDLFASVLLGRGDGNDVASASLERDVPPRTARVTRVEP
jgi:nitroreductase